MNIFTKLKAIIIIIIIFFIVKTVSSQNEFNSLSDCPDISVEESLIPFYGGLYKPQRTDFNGLNASPPAARLNILLVFVQFSNESAQSNEWPIGDSAIYMHDFVAEIKDTVGDYWNRYNENTETFSDWFQEVSMGTMHVTGKAYNIILDHTDTYYNDSGVSVMNTEIYQKLENLGTINWHDYDLWRKYPHGDSLFRYEPDGYIDMIFKIHRHRGNTTNLFDGSGGFAYLKGNTYSVVIGQGDTVKIDPAYSTQGSGLTIFGTAGGPVNKLFAYEVAKHEYGHYILGSHRNCGIMGQGDGFLNPWESVRLGYMDRIDVNYNTSTYGLYDYASRNRSGQILQVPVEDSTEFFIITNRSKVSRYDVMMYGDTSKGDPFLDVGNYGKGIYIYHATGIFSKNGWSYNSLIDQECADGLYNWTQTGYDAPEWNPGAFCLPVLKPTSVSYNNEITCWTNCQEENYYNTDDRNVKGRSCSNAVETKWFSIGAKPNTDKIYTNANENWTSRSHKGDRYDAWNVGYNEIFSPYSSPSTNSWDNDITGIYIWHYSSTSSGPSGLAYFKIFKAGEGGYTDSSILQITPPSRPMGLVVDYHLQTEDIMRPLLTWNHNMEPDMLNSNNKKKYKIWRATSSSMNGVPVDYTVHNIVEIDSGTSPSYIDTTIFAIGSGWPGSGNTVQYPARYKIQAIDKYQDSSVRSDFDVAIGLERGAGCAECVEEGGPDNFINDTEIPKEYNLYGNYPNPFNPTTNIKFDLPKDVLVSIKIYDMLGREIRTLVNDYKTAGSYTISFNGADLSSGIYYYKIKAGDFEQVRKMMLLK